MVPLDLFNRNTKRPFQGTCYILHYRKYRKRSIIRIDKSVVVTDMNDRSPNASNEETLEAGKYTTTESI